MMDTVVNFLYAAILSGTPLLFGTVGEITTQKRATSTSAWKG